MQGEDIILENQEYNFHAKHLKNGAEDSISLELVRKMEDQYIFYEFILTQSKLDTFKQGVFSDLDIVYDCLKHEESRIILPSISQVRVQAKIMVGKKNIIKEIVLQLNKKEMTENEMLRLMINDLKKQIKDLKGGKKPIKKEYQPNPNENNSQNHPAGDAYSQMMSGSEQKKEKQKENKKGEEGKYDPSLNAPKQKVQCNHQ